MVREVVRPAFAAYRKVLAEELLPVARPDEQPGLCWLGDDGVDIYRRLLRHHTTLPDLGADEIHQLGLDELAGLRAEYAEIGERLFGLTDLGEIFARLREDSALRYGDGEEIMVDARACLAAAQQAMGEWFGRLPVQSCDILPVPEFLAADAPAAYYFPPAADGSRPGAYYVNLHDPKGRNRYETASVAYHEAIPGHHLQLTIANELDHLPRFQRMSFANTAFVEGWASTPNAWPTKWVCTRTISPASACSPPIPGAPAAWWSTPACTPKAGPVNRPSTSWSPTPR